MKLIISILGYKLEKKLEYIFNNVNDWLKFAEAKNAALLAFNIGVIVGVARLIEFEFNKILSDLSTAYIVAGLMLLVISSLICLLSFIPRLHIPWISYKEKPNMNRNTLFFNDISSHVPKTYLEECSKKMGEGLPNNTEYLEDLATQIIVNSRIALVKYYLFSGAIWITLSAIVTPVIALLLYFFNKKQTG